MPMPFLSLMPLDAHFNRTYQAYKYHLQTSCAHQYNGAAVPIRLLCGCRQYCDTRDCVAGAGRPVLEADIQRNRLHLLH